MPRSDAGMEPGIAQEVAQGVVFSAQDEFNIRAPVESRGMSTGPNPTVPHPALPAQVMDMLTEYGVTRDIEARTVLFRQGEVADSMFMVVHGEVEVYFEEGKAAKTLGPGMIVGEIALLTATGRRTATAVTAGPCRLKIVDRATFEDLIRREPTLMCRALQQACSYLVDSEQLLIADLRERNSQLETTLDYLRRTREELDTIGVMAQTDELTGLYNRRCLSDQLPKYIARAGGDGLAVLVINLDKFKPINDTYGHAAGDLVLRQVAEVIRETVRSTDLPCRTGGDEFAAVLAPATEAVARTVALRLRKAIAEREIHSLGVLLKVGATVGGTMWREEDDVASIVARADEYLYAAKVAGRNRVGWQGDILED